MKNALITELTIERAVEKKFSNVDIEKLLDESEKELENDKTKYLTHDEVFSKARRLIDGFYETNYKLS